MDFLADILEIIIVCIVGVAILYLLYYLARWIFSINRQLKYQETIIEILSEIAARQGVPAETIKKFKQRAEG